MNKNSTKIREFILEQVKQHSSDLVSIVAEKFRFSRQQAHAYVVKEVNAGKIIKIGATNNTRYFLVGGKHIEFSLKIKPDLDEYQVWTKYVKPMTLHYSKNIQSICSYSFTEILNNANHHSEGTTIYISIIIENNNINIEILDNGIGIFRKIKEALNLESLHEAILHLSKGKFTTDPKHHTGEGIFFTSRVSDKFIILSNNMSYIFKNKDWFLSDEKKENIGRGTYIKINVSLNSSKTLKSVMDQYSNEEIGFGKTIVAVILSADPGDPHVSRSQAKRLLAGLDKFKYVVLDFKGVKSVGQAFVDEVFRVFHREHPDILIEYINAIGEVDSMIKRGLATQKLSS